MVLDKHNKHSIIHKKEMRKHNTVGQIFSESSPVGGKTPANPDNVLFFLCLSTHKIQLNKHSSEGFPFPEVLFLSIWETVHCKLS